MTSNPFYAVSDTNIIHLYAAEDTVREERRMERRKPRLVVREDKSAKSLMSRSTNTHVGEEQAMVFLVFRGHRLPLVILVFGYLVMKRQNGFTFRTLITPWATGERGLAFRSSTSSVPPYKGHNSRFSYSSFDGPAVDLHVTAGKTAKCRYTRYQQADKTKAAANT